MSLFSLARGSDKVTSILHFFVATFSVQIVDIKMFTGRSFACTRNIRMKFKTQFYIRFTFVRLSNRSPNKIVLPVRNYFPARPNRYRSADLIAQEPGYLTVYTRRLDPWSSLIPLQTGNLRCFGALWGRFLGHRRTLSTLRLFTYIPCRICYRLPPKINEPRKWN